MSCFLELKDVSKSYKIEKDELSVLNDININVCKGELLTIVGPSGCGKSTLLALLAGFLEPDTGNIIKDGQSLTGPDVDRIMIFQNFEQLFPWKTVLANVVFPLKAKKIGDSMRERIDIAQKCLRKVQLEEFINYYPHQLSGGMKQRVALARALVATPEILLMDEPFGSLDSQTRDLLQDMLLKIWQEQDITIVFVTHDIREAIVLSDRIIVIDKETGSIKKIINNKLTRPRNRLGEEFSNLYQQIYELL